jgi:hypothetical protein
MVKQGEGEVGWQRIFAGIITAAIVGLVAATWDQAKEIAAIKASREATIKAYGDRIAALENGTTSATSERYRASDAHRDFERIEERIQRLEDKQHAHELDDRVKFKSMGR